MTEKGKITDNGLRICKCHGDGGMVEQRGIGEGNVRQRKEGVTWQMKEWRCNEATEENGDNQTWD